MANPSIKTECDKVIKLSIIIFYLWMMWLPSCSHSSYKILIPTIWVYLGISIRSALTGTYSMKLKYYCRYKRLGKYGSFSINEMRSHYWINNYKLSFNFILYRIRYYWSFFQIIAPLSLLEPWFQRQQSYQQKLMQINLILFDE